MTIIERVRVKRTKRLHPEWTTAQVWAHCTTEGLIVNRTAEDVERVILSMPEYREDQGALL